MRTMITIALASFVAAPIAAQDTTAAPADTTESTVSATLTLSEAIDIARQHNAPYRQSANDATPAAWGVRSAYSALLPRLSVTGALGYRGPGTQTFLTTTFQQSSATVSSSYTIGLNMSLSAETFMQPALARAQRDATQAQIGAAEQALESLVTGQFLTVLQAQANLELQRRQVARSQESRRLAQGRFDVGQVTRIDVRQAEVTEAQARVEQLRLEQSVRVEKLRLFQILGVEPPVDVMSVALEDAFTMDPPRWSLDSLIAIAAEQNPMLAALRESEAAARWQARSARTSYLPSVSISAGWSGFTQQFTNPDPLIQSAIASQQDDAAGTIASCEYQNDILSRLADPLPPTDCTQYAFTTADATQLEQQIRAENSVFPFSFTRQPFSAALYVSLPVFNGFQRELQLSQAEARADDAALAAHDQELQMRADVTARFYDTERAHQTIAIQEQARAAGRDQLELATERYRLGQGSFLELTEAQVAAQTAERDYVNARYEYQRAVVLLEQAVGVRLR